MFQLNFIKFKLARLLDYPICVKIELYTNNILERNLVFSFKANLYSPSMIQSAFFLSDLQYPLKVKKLTIVIIILLFRMIIT